VFNASLQRLVFQQTHFAMFAILARMAATREEFAPVEELSYHARRTARVFAVTDAGGEEFDKAAGGAFAAGRG
jgi:hypothetical protein